MYRIKIITDIGIYAVPMEVETEKEDPTINDLMLTFLETKSDVEAGCFMEGWTPEDNLTEAPGVFALGKNIQILAYHVERVSEIRVATAEPQDAHRMRPLTRKIDYLGNTLYFAFVTSRAEQKTFLYCYSVNGEPPTDVLELKRLRELIEKDITKVSGDIRDYVVFFSEDGHVRNFSQATETLNDLISKYREVTKEKTGKAWNGWKEDD